jgi:hypothetical protein|nr:MAG TPA: hypothetical protein [Caudoviricetes sp.]
MCLFITHFKPKVAARNIKVYKAFMLTFPEELEDSKVLTGVIRNYYIPTNHLMDDTDNYASIKNVDFPIDSKEESPSPYIEEGTLYWEGFNGEIGAKKVFVTNQCVLVGTGNSKRLETYNDYVNQGFIKQ